MKEKILAILLAAALCLGFGVLSGCGASKPSATAEPETTAAAQTSETTAQPSATEPANVTVYVTISDAGKLAAVQMPVAVTDEDADGKLTVNDALIAAHGVYTGGAAAGYATEEGQYGLSITKLWGVENGGSYGFYVNNVASESLTDPVADGDYLTAFSYSDLSKYSDVYSYFDNQTASVAAGASLTLKLSYVGFDANFKPVVNPAAGAAITIDGQKTEYVTGSDGTVTVSFAAAGNHIISAVSGTETLVPPVCTVTVG